MLLHYVTNLRSGKTTVQFIDLQQQPCCKSTLLIFMRFLPWN